MELTERTIKSETLYEGVVVTLTLDEVELPNGHRARREVARHPAGVAVVALDDQNRIALVEQYRYPMGQVMLELPAGKLEPGENPADGGARELGEETGLEAGEMISLGSVVSSPGFCDEELFLYLARDLKRGRSHPDEDEFLEVSWVPMDTLVKRIMDGTVTDGKTVAGVLKAKLWLER